MCWSIPCEAAHPRGHASASTCVISPKNSGRRRKLQSQTMIPHGSGGGVGRTGARNSAVPNGPAVVGFSTLGANKCRRIATYISSSLWKNCRQFLRRNNFKLGVGTIAGLFVRSPSAELRRVPEAISLHVVVSNFYN